MYRLRTLFKEWADRLFLDEERLMPMSRQQLSDLLEKSISDGVVVMDEYGRILWSNDAYLAMTGYEMFELHGRKPQEILMPVDHRPSQEEIEAFRFSDYPGLFHDYEIVQNIRKNGDEYWVQLSFGRVEREEHRLVVCTSRDVTDQIEAQVNLAQAKAELEHAVNFDALTGLANRRKLTEVLSQSLNAAAQDNSLVALCHIDLDKFKEINDTHGHAAGDAVLVHAAKALQTATRSGDLAARVGGDEFVVVIPNAPSSENISAFAARVLSLFSDPFQFEDLNLSVSASIGIALSEPGQLDGEGLIQKADFALYEVKRNGKGTFAFYDQRLRKKHHLRKSMAADLKDAIDRDGLTFFYQPIISAEDRKVTAVETLARWKHPEKGIVAPIHFLGMAEDMGLLSEVDFAAMRASAKALSEIRALGLTNIGASFNASAHTLSGRGLTEKLIWTADTYDIPHQALCVEVLETVFFGDAAAESDMAREIEKLGQSGFRTMLDDFGVGYAGLSHLAQLNVTGIKIDRSLVLTMASDQSKSAIVRSIIRLTQELGLNVVAEGVEDGMLAADLAQTGCTFLQGYGIARPMPLQDLLVWLEHYDPDQVFLDPKDGKVAKAS